MTHTKQILMAALEAGIMCAELLIKQGGAAATEIREEELPLLKKALSLAQQLDENVSAGVDAGIKSDFSAIWDAVEKVESKLHDKYHFHLPAVKKALADAHRMFRPLWDKLNAPRNPLTFLDDESAMEEVADELAPYFSSADRMYKEHIEAAQVVIATIKRLAQSKTTGGSDA